jgi:hypothetical protein
MTEYFTITIRKTRDFLRLEHQIRQLLNCQGRVCSFFQSATYVNLRLSIVAYLTAAGAKPAPCLLPISTSPFMLLLLDDGCTLLVKTATVFYGDTVTTVPQKIDKKEETFLTALSRSRHS